MTRVTEVACFVCISVEMKAISQMSASLSLDPGLPDGAFLYKNPNFGKYILKGLGIIFMYV
jgi:hypothetical protein